MMTTTTTTEDPNSNNNNNNNNHHQQNSGLALIESLLLDPNNDSTTTITTTNSTSGSGTDTIIETLNAQDLEKALILESSINDTILLQNVAFDPNFFDRVNLDLSNTNTTTRTTIVNNCHNLSVGDEDNVVDDGDLTLTSQNPSHPTSNPHHTFEHDLDNIELQLLKETSSSPNSNSNNQSHRARTDPTATFLTSSSSDPLVSSTTATFPPSFDGDPLSTNDPCDFDVNNDGDVDIQYFRDTTIKTSNNNNNHESTTTTHPTLTLIQPHQQQSQSSSIVSNESTAQNQNISSIPIGTTTQMPHQLTSNNPTPHQQHQTFVNEKVFLTTAGPISTLSLANMKVVGSNVLAIISDQQQPQKREQQDHLHIHHQKNVLHQHHQGSISGGSCQPNIGTRLIIIEEKQQPISDLNSHQQQLQQPIKNSIVNKKQLINNNNNNKKEEKCLKSSNSNIINTLVTGNKHCSNNDPTKGGNHQHNNVANGSNNNGDSSSSTSTTTAATTAGATNPQQFTDADSNSGNPSSKAFVPCKVCGDKASGYHYGVTSCEGCKGFFRRSIQKQIEYRCLRDGKCLIIRLNRNRCQYCRFKKCLAVGMSRDSVRYGRVPKKSKEKERMDENKRVTQAEADQSSNGDSESKDLACYEIALTISQAHHDNCSYTTEKIKGINKKPIFLLSSQLKHENKTCSSPDIGSVSESLEAQKIELWEHLALLITPCIQRVVEFAKRIPGFSDLTQDDQLILIKLGFFEVWLVHISKTVDFIENTLTFADGSFLSRRQLELMFNHEFVGNLFHLMSGLNSLNLTDEEVALFSAIIILQSDRPQIYDVKSINKIQETIIAALKFQINKHRENESLQTTFQKLMMKINELRALGSSHSLHLQWFRTNWSRLKLPPLFAEIFDIPKLSSFATQQQSSNNNPTNNNTEPMVVTNQSTNQIQPISTNSNSNNNSSSSSSSSLSTTATPTSSQVQIQPATTTQTIIKTEPFETAQNGPITIKLEEQDC